MYCVLVLRWGILYRNIVEGEFLFVSRCICTEYVPEAPSAPKGDSHQSIVLGNVYMESLGESCKEILLWMVNFCLSQDVSLQNMFRRRLRRPSVIVNELSYWGMYTWKVLGNPVKNNVEGDFLFVSRCICTEYVPKAPSKPKCDR